MLPKRLIALTLFAALAVMPACGLRAQWIPTNGPSGGSVNSFTTLGNKIFAGTQEIGVLVSTDGGLNWTSASSDLSQTHVTALAVSGSDLYAGTFYAQVYRSTDSGSTWTQLNTGAYDEIRAFEVTNGSVFAASGLSGILRSTDGGNKWLKVSSGITSNYINAFAFVGSTLYAAGSGVFRSTNNGNVWTPFSNGLIDSECFTLSVNGSNLFLGTNSGTFVSDGNSPWMATSAIVPPYTIATNTLLTIGDNLFAGTFNGLFRTTDAGNSWSAVNSELTDSTSICNLSTDGKNIFIGTFYGATYGVWRRPLSDFGISSVTKMPVIVQPDIRCYPNPLSQSTTISFTPEASGYADVSIVNLLGVEVVHLFSGEVSAGEQHFTWVPTGASDGIYECLVRMNGRVETLPVVVAH